MKLFKSLRGKIVFWIFLLTALPLLAVSIFSTMYAVAVLRAEAEAKLQAVAELKEKQLLEIFQHWSHDVVDFASNPDVISNLAELSVGFQELGGQRVRLLYLNKEDLEDAGDGSAYSSTHRELHRFTARYAALQGYDDVVMVDLYGNLIYSLKKDQDYGLNLLSGTFKGGGHAGVYRQAETDTAGKAFLVDVSAGSNDITMHIGAPCYSEGELIGIVFFDCPFGMINVLMQQRAGMGQTGETYLVGSDLRMRSDSYLAPERLSVAASLAGTIEENGVDTFSVREALAGRSGSSVIRDYRDVLVLSVYCPVKTMGLEWALLAEIDHSEAVRPAQVLRTRLLVMAAAITALVVIFGLIAARGITEPINRVAGIARSMARGTLPESVEIKRHDEIGNLGDSLNVMIISWRKIVAQLTEGATNLSSSSAEIAASAEQTARGAESQMEQIVKTSAGMEEMSTSIQEVSENAMATSKEAEDSSLRAKASAGKIKEAIEGILESGKSIAQLNERVQEVGKVVEIIGGIAEQTNILSLNAAIEAARAGEQGKGFDVVAGEIRNLALGTTESTAEIREILEEIQKETGRAVDTIESGTAKTGMVGESLDVILEGLLATTEKVQLISSLAAEQSKTAEEIAESLQKISQVSQDSAGSSIESKNAITELVELAERLKGITDLFKLEEAASTVNEYYEGKE